MRRVFLFLFVVLFLAACRQDSRQWAVAPSAAVQLDTVPGSSPYLTTDHKGNAVISWVRQYNDSSGVFCYAVSRNGGRSFGAPVLIPASTNVAPHSENIPKVVFKPSGEIIAVWGAGNPNPKNKYSGLVWYAQSFDEGRTWTAARQLVQDTAGFDQRYFDVAILPDGEAGIVWLDNRKPAPVEGSALYLAHTKGKEGFGNEKRISFPCCQCCRTDLFVDKKKNIHVLYRGILADSIRDMVHVVSTDGGNTFSEPARISQDNWVIRGCPHTGPAMTENEEGLHFAWYTGGKKKGSFYTRSADNGKSFTGEDSISGMGKHPQLTTSENGDVLVVWDEAVKKGAKFYNRIGMEKRSASGQRLGQSFLTADTLKASYPVISPRENGTSLVAYCLEKNGQKYVTCQLVQESL